LSPELATLALFSDRLTSDDKAQLVLSMTSDRGPRLLKSLPKVITELRVSRSFFQTTGIDDCFLDSPVEHWPSTKSYKDAVVMVNNLASTNDCAERGVALIQAFNASTKDEDQRQYLLQVVEKHRSDFPKCDRDYLQHM